MRALIGWTLALASSALLGAALYQAVLNDPLARPVAGTAAVGDAPTLAPRPTVTRTEVRTVVDPTPTVTVEEVVDRPATLRATSGEAAAPNRTSAPRPTLAAAPPAQRVDDDERADHQAEQARELAEHEAEQAEHEAEQARESAEHEAQQARERAEHEAEAAAEAGDD
jgi:hypothetical protein